MLFLSANRFNSRAPNQGTGIGYLCQFFKNGFLINISTKYHTILSLWHFVFCMHFVCNQQSTRLRDDITKFVTPNGSS